MARIGILHEDSRVELLAGDVVEMSPIGVRHGACVKRLNQLFSRRFADRAVVGVQDPAEEEGPSDSGQ